MPQAPRTIRIAIQEPSPDWWQHVKRHARHHGTFVSHFVVMAVEHYLKGCVPELISPDSQENRRKERK